MDFNLKCQLQLLVLLLFFLPAVAQNNTSDTLKVNKVDAKGQKQGYWEKRDSAGILLYRGQFLDNQPYGEFKYYYESGKIKNISQYANGGKIAYTVAYHPNGSKMAVGKYIDMKKDSLWRYFNRNEALVSEEFYQKGQPYGTWKKYYETSQVAEIVTYKNGLKEGPWVQYYADGKPKIKGHYIEDKLEGTFQSFYLDGILRAEGQYKGSLKQGEWIYYNEQKQPEKKEIYKDGVMVKEETLIDKEGIWEK